MTAMNVLGKAARVLFSLLCFLAIWQGIAMAVGASAYVLPRPLQVLSALVDGIASGTYVLGLWATVSAVLLGFVLGSLAGILLAILLVLFPVLERVLFPYIVALQSLPKVAIAPLMIVWFGFGLSSKLFIIAMICSFPVLINTLAGLQSAEQIQVELISALCGSRLQTIRYVRLPSSLPYVFSGLSSALILAVTGAIVAEFVGARHGIGVLILKADFNLDIAGVFALLLLLGGTSAILGLALKYIGRRVLYWT